MKANLGALRLAIGLVASLSVCGPALLQKPGASAIACFGQSGEHVDPRRINDRGPWADDGGAVRSSSIPRRNLLEPYVKGLTLMVNSIFNGNCREDIWLDK